MICKDRLELWQHKICSGPAQMIVVEIKRASRMQTRLWIDSKDPLGAPRTIERRKHDVLPLHEAGQRQIEALGITAPPDATDVPSSSPA